MYVHGPRLVICGVLDGCGVFYQIQTSFCRGFGIALMDALMEFNVLPLITRRDMSMFGVIHCAVIGCGPPQWRSISQTPSHRFCGRRHRFLIEPFLEVQLLQIAKRSCLGLVPPYKACIVTWLVAGEMCKPSKADCNAW